MRFSLLFLCLGFATPLMSQGDVCRTVIGVAVNGDIYDLHSMAGAPVRRSAKTLEGQMHESCYNDSHPSEITSVTLEVARGAPKARLELVYAIFARNGWPKERVKEVIWTDAPR